MKALGIQVSGQEMDDLFKRFDTDRDGKLGYAEYLQLLGYKSVNTPALSSRRLWETTIALEGCVGFTNIARSERPRRVAGRNAAAAAAVYPTDGLLTGWPFSFLKDRPSLHCTVRRRAEGIWHPWEPTAMVRLVAVCLCSSHREWRPFKWYCSRIGCTERQHQQQR